MTRATMNLAAQLATHVVRDFPTATDTELGRYVYDRLTRGVQRDAARGVQLDDCVSAVRRAIAERLAETFGRVAP